MFKPTAVYDHLIAKENIAKNGQTPQLGSLLVTQQGEIIYANTQARHFLGLLADEPLPTEQTFLSLVAATYQCESVDTWLDWPKRPSAATTRHLIYKQNNTTFARLRVEVLQQLLIDKTPIWAITMIAEESHKRYGCVSASC